jgi:hypothetical protein
MRGTRGRRFVRARGEGKLRGIGIIRVLGTWNDCGYVTRETRVARKGGTMCNALYYLSIDEMQSARSHAHQKCLVLTHSFNVPVSFAFKPRPSDSRFQLMYINILYIVPDANSQRGKFIASAAVYEPPTAIGKISGNWSRLRKTSVTRIRLYCSRSNYQSSYQINSWISLQMYARACMYDIFDIII